MSDMVRLDYHKSTQRMHVYRTIDDDAFAPLVYARKRIVGDPPPAFITLICFPSQETTDERYITR